MYRIIALLNHKVIDVPRRLTVTCSNRPLRTWLHSLCITYLLRNVAAIKYLVNGISCI